MSETYQEFRTLRRRIMERDFSRMNDPQRQAVFHTDGPLLILAGAGYREIMKVLNVATDNQLRMVLATQPVKE